MKYHTKIFLFTTLDKCYTTNSLNPLWIIINTINRCIEESNGNTYFTLVPTDESKVTLKKYGLLRNEIRYFARSVTNNADNYDENNMEIKFNSDDTLPLKNR